MDHANNLTLLVATAISAASLENPAVAAIMAAVMASRQTLYKLIGGDNGVVLASPWPIPLMLAPIRSAEPSSDELAWTVFSEGTWSSKKFFGGSNFTKARPVLAPFGDDLFLLHRGAGDENIWHIKYDSDLGWGSSDRIGTYKTSLEFGACEYRNRLHVVHCNSGKGLFDVRFDGNSWSSSMRMNSMYALSGPALAVFKDKLYCVARGTDNQLWYTSLDGYDWSSYVKVRGGGAYTSSGPALAVYKNNLICVA